MSVAIVGGHVLTESGLVRSDVFIEDSNIADMGVGIADGTTTIDASGCVVGPGFVDLHVHLRDPGQTWKEDLESGSTAASKGGFTAIVAMPNTEPALDRKDAVRELSKRADALGLVETHVAAALTVGRSGRDPVDVESLSESGIVMFSDDGDSVSRPDVLVELMRRIASVGGVVSQHAEDSDLTSRGHMHEGSVSRVLGVGGLPMEAETAVVTRDLALVAATGARYHCQHISAAATLDLLRNARDSGLNVTSEVTPHHLWFTDEDVGAHLDTDLKMYPPLRTSEDRRALRRGLSEGLIDCVATDHAPHTVDEKGVSFEDAPRGVIGLETAASATWTVLEDLSRLFEVMSVAPAQIMGMDRQGRWPQIGGPANLVVFAPDETWIPQDFASRSSNSPFMGIELTGRVRATIYEGKVTHQLSMTT